MSDISYKGVGVIVKNKKDQFLLHLRDDGTPNMPQQWCLIGGHIENNEEPVAVAKREVFEESSLTLETVEYIKDLQFNGMRIALMYGIVDAVQENIVLGEGAAMKFFDKQDVNTFIQALPYSNPYLHELQTFLRKF